MHSAAAQMHQALRWSSSSIKGRMLQQFQNSAAPAAQQASLATRPSSYAQPRVQSESVRPAATITSTSAMAGA
jgi:hypothetical protein